MTHTRLAPMFTLSSISSVTMTTDDVAVCRIVASNNGQVKLNGQP